MNSTREERSPEAAPRRPALPRGGLRPISSLVLIGSLGLIWYCWVAPISSPRGGYLGGHYRLLDLYLGVPAGFGVLFSSLHGLARRPGSRRAVLRWALAAAAGFTTLLGLDVAYALFLPESFRFAGVYLLPQPTQPDAEVGVRGRPRIQAWSRRRFWDPQAGLRVYPALHRTDEHGYRNEPGIGTADVVCIGDSYTHSVDFPRARAWPGQVEVRSGLRVVNLGWGGYGPQQELRALQRYGLSRRPRLVIWQLFEGNDLRNAEEFEDWLRGPDLPYEAWLERKLKRANPSPAHRTPLALRYVTRSPLVRLLDRTLPQWAGEETGVRLRYPDGRTRPERLLTPYGPSLPRRWPRGTSLTIGELKAGAQLCRQRGTSLLLVLAPVPVRALEPALLFDSPGERQRLLPEGRLDSPSDFCSTFRRVAAGLGVPSLDLTDPLRRAARENPDLFLPEDGHLTEAGHGVVAREVLARLPLLLGGTGRTPRAPETAAP